MPGTLDDAALEFTRDLLTVYEDEGLTTDAAKAVMMKYARLLLIRDTLPHVLISLQYYTTKPKGKEAIATALKLLAAARGVTL